VCNSIENQPIGDLDNGSAGELTISDGATTVGGQFTHPSAHNKFSTLTMLQEIVDVLDFYVSNGFSKGFMRLQLEKARAETSSALEELEILKRSFGSAPLHHQPDRCVSSISLTACVSQRKD
jgi:hypothetical protein